MDCLKFLIEKRCLKPPKYAKFKLLIKFVKNGTLIRWQILTMQGKFYSGKRGLVPIVFDPPFLTSFLFGNFAHSSGKAFVYCNI